MVRVSVAFLMITSAFSLCLADDHLPVPVCIEGVMVEKQSSLAIINGQVYKVGDKIQGAEITAITGNTVRFNYQGVVYALPVGYGSKNAPAQGAHSTAIPATCAIQKACWVSDMSQKIRAWFQSIFKNANQESRIQASTHDDHATVDKIFNTKVEPNPALFDEYYAKAERLYEDAKAQESINRDSAFKMYGAAAQAATWAIQYSPRACAEKHGERSRMFEVLNRSVNRRALLRQ